MMGRAVVLGMIWALVFAGCADGPGEGVADMAVGVDMTVDLGGEDLGAGTDMGLDMAVDEGPAWEAITSAAVSDEGASEAFVVALPAGARSVMVRVRPDGEDAQVCYGFERVELGSGRALVAPAGRYMDGGLLLITDPEVLAEADTLTIEIAMYDCDLGSRISRARAPGMARTLLVDRLVEAPPAEGAEASLEVRFLRAGGLDDAPDDLLRDERFLASWAFASSIYADAGVTLRFGGEATREEAVPFARVGPGEWDAPLDTDARDALRAVAPGERFVPVVLVPCISWQDATSGPTSLDGFTGRIPGLLRAERPRAVILWAVGCTLDLDTRRAGVVLAHEIGHYLGLYHSDTDEGGHLAGAADERLMDSTIGTQVALDEARFSEAQVVWVLGHPDVVF